MEKNSVKSKRERKPRHFKREELKKFFGVNTMAEFREKYGDFQPQPPNPEPIGENRELLYMVLDEDKK